MPHDRFYSPTSLEKEATLEGEEFHHLARVMRKKEGDTVELVNGKGTLALGVIQTVTKREALITITKSQTKEPALPPITLIQALPKMASLELIIQKGTELGASAFHLYHSELSEKKELSENQKKRLSHVLIGAMKQCGRLDLPTLTWGFPQLEGHVYFGDLSPDAPFLSTVATLPATLIIGPEKGFTEKETLEMQEKGKGVRLSPYILRTETAAIAGLTILTAAWEQEAPPKDF